MEDAPVGPEAFPKTRERFLALVEFLKSERALEMPFSEVEAMVEPGFQAMLAELRKEYGDLQAGRADGGGAAGEEPGDAS